MINIRSMRAADIEQIVALEQENPSPWSKKIFDQELQKKVQSGVVQKTHTILLVAETKHLPKHVIIGWLCISGTHPEAELEKIVIAQQYRRRGVAQLLLQKGLAAICLFGYSKIFLEVRKKNSPALNFYEKHDFKQVGVRTAYYSKPLDDALILRKSLCINKK